MEGSRITYVVVKPGETMDDLSVRYGISIDELKRLNRGTDTVEQGSVLKVWQAETPLRAPQTNTHFVLGFYASQVGVALPGSQPSFEKNSQLLSAIAPYWFDLDGGARLGKIKARVAPAVIKRQVADAHNRGVKILASIFNTHVPGGPAARTEVLHNVLKAHRMTFFNELFALVDEYGFDGINLDFELLRDGDRELFTDFVRDLADRAHKKGLLVLVDVRADGRKTPFAHEVDYTALSAVVDYLVLLTYDQYKPTEPVPGPVEGLSWVQETLQKALQEGVPAAKILLGVAAYGYDWPVGHPARALSYEAVGKLQQKHKAAVQFHATEKVPHFAYDDEKGQAHEVWYEDARSLALKLDLVRKYNLGGIVLWRLGLEDPAAWGVIRAKLSPIA